MIVALSSEPATFGLSQTWTNGQYRFSGGTSPLLLLLSVWFLTLYVLLNRGKPVLVGRPLPGIIRRFVAFLLDFVVAMLIFTPVLGIVPTVVEWRRTRVFQWHFERTFLAPADSLLVNSLMGAIAILLFLYFLLPLVRRRPSPGTCILGYQVIADEGGAIKFDTAILRMFLGFIALLVWPISASLGRDRQNGKYWVDRVFKTRAVRTE